MRAGCLHHLVGEAARRTPKAVAVEEPGAGEVTYRELDALASRMAARLAGAGIGRGARVGFWLRKSIDAVATLLGTLKSGAAYVPLDPGAPAGRNAYILSDCDVAAIVVEARFADALKAELGDFAEKPHWVVVAETGAGRGLERALAEGAGPAAPPGPDASPDDLAYVLYTSGSTGRPKGVAISHRAAMSFVQWCVDTFEPVARDRFSSHAPFHFDLSIFDLYVPQTCGAALVLVEEERAGNPLGLAELIAERRISVWYSAPSILSLLARHGKLGQRELPDLRMVLFAGEVFPIVHLRALHDLLPHPRYFNLYGPTETNVCTYYELPRRIPAAREEPFPIGRVCAHYRGLVVDVDGEVVAPGAEGELCMAGPGVMDGYWNLPDQTERAFLARDGERWYRTGDVVAEEDDGNLRFLGRRDRMVKRRGFRIELDEIEACLYLHPAVSEAAVVAVPDTEDGLRIEAHVATAEGGKLSLIGMKQFCAESLPRYMIPDSLRLHDALPKTSTAKVDYQRLRQER